MHYKIKLNGGPMGVLNLGVTIIMLRLVFEFVKRLK